MSKFKTQTYNVKPPNDLKIRSFRFSLEIIKFTAPYLTKATESIISKQLIRSATSIGANIIEANASSSRREFVKYYDIALKSANETVYWLQLFKESNLAKEIEKVEKLIDECQQICIMLGSSIITLKGKR